MRPGILWMVLFLIPLVLRAGELTAGWSVPIERFAPDFPTTKGLRKLEKPPEESAFFQAGDELWDVSQVREWPDPMEQEAAQEDPFGGDAGRAKTKPWQGKWIVWNARSRVFVACGSWNDIFAAEAGLGFEEQASVIRSSFELESAGKPVRALSVISRSAEQAVMRTDDMTLEFSVTASGDGALADLGVKTLWKEEAGDGRWMLATAVAIHDASRQLVASHGSGASSWKLFATTRCEFLGGVLRSDGRWIEVEGKLRQWRMQEHHKPSLRKAIKGDLFVSGFGMDGDYLNRMRRGAKFPFPVVEVPEALKELTQGPVVDLREWLATLGVNVSRPGFFGGFDLLGSRVLVVGDLQTVDLFEQLGPMYCGAPGSLWISTNEASGGWGVGARSGERARLVRLDAEGKEELVFEVEPTLGADSRIIDLRLKADMVAGEVSRGRVESAVTLEAGKPTEVARRVGPDSESVVMEVTAAVVPFKN